MWCAVLDPSILRVSVKGDVLGLEAPRSALARSFMPVSVSLYIVNLREHSSSTC